MSCDCGVNMNDVKQDIYCGDKYSHRRSHHFIFLVVTSRMCACVCLENAVTRIKQIPQFEINWYSAVVVDAE